MGGNKEEEILTQGHTQHMSSKVCDPICLLLADITVLKWCWSEENEMTREKTTTKDDPAF